MATPAYPHSLSKATQAFSGVIEEPVDNITCLLSTLYGLRSSIIRNFGSEPYNLKIVPIVMADNFKEPLQKMLNQTNKTSTVAHPYLYLDLTNIELLKDQNPIKNLHRDAYINRHMTTDRSVSRGFLFPAALTLTSHYIDTDIERILSFIELFLLLANSGELNFTLVYGDSYEWVGTVSSDSNVSLNKAMLEDSAMPGEIDVTTNIRIDTKLGFVKSVYKVNKDAPTINNTLITSQLIGR